VVKYQHHSTAPSNFAVTAIKMLGQLTLISNQTTNGFTKSIPILNNQERPFALEVKKTHLRKRKRK